MVWWSVQSLSLCVVLVPVFCFGIPSCTLAILVMARQFEIESSLLLVMSAYYMYMYFCINTKYQRNAYPFFEKLISVFTKAIVFWYALECSRLHISICVRGKRRHQDITLLATAFVTYKCNSHTLIVPQCYQWPQKYYTSL